MVGKKKNRSFYLSQRTFFLTFPQCQLDKNYVFDFLLNKHTPNVLVIAQEQHKDLKLHFHVWIEFEKRITIRDPRYFDIDNFHCNIGKIRHTECNSRKNALKYITKFDKNPLVFGLNLHDYLKINRKKICEDLILNKKTLLDIIQENPQELYYYDKLKNNLNLYFIDLKKTTPIIERKCYWIYGPSGIGKSYLVRDAFINIYEKSNNIWWDGYNNEEVVLIDDFDKSCLKLTYYLKIWADKYRFNAEIKGGSIQPSYGILIVTSNYSIYELFNIYDNEIYSAIKRRFIELNINNKEDLEDAYIKIKNVKIYHKLNILIK